jgi:hypothetical protein
VAVKVASSLTVVAVFNFRVRCGCRRIAGLGVAAAERWCLVVVKAVVSRCWVVVKVADGPTAVAAGDSVGAGGRARGRVLMQVDGRAMTRLGVVATGPNVVAGVTRPSGGSWRGVVGSDRDNFWVFQHEGIMRGQPQGERILHNFCVCLVLCTKRQQLLSAEFFAHGS